MPKLDFIHLLQLALATFRLTVMLTKDNGPGWIFKKLRGLVKKETPKKAHLDEGVECPWCASVWFGTAWAIADFYLHDNPVYAVILLAIALSGAAVILNQAFTKD
jgi:hypothetical protein